MKGVERERMDEWEEAEVMGGWWGFKYLQVTLGKVPLVEEFYVGRYSTSKLQGRFTRTYLPTYGKVPYLGNLRNVFICT